MQLLQPADKEICDTPVLSFELLKHSPTHISSEASYEECGRNEEKATWNGVAYRRYPKHVGS